MAASLELDHVNKLIKAASEWFPEPVEVEYEGKRARLLGGHNTDTTAIMVFCKCDECKAAADPNTPYFALESWCYGHCTPVEIASDEDDEGVLAQAEETCLTQVKVVSKGGQPVEPMSLRRYARKTAKKAGIEAGSVFLTYWYDQEIPTKDNADKAAWKRYSQERGKSWWPGGHALDDTGVWYKAVVVEVDKKTGVVKIEYPVERNGPDKDGQLYLGMAYTHFCPPGNCRPPEKGRKPCLLPPSASPKPEATQTTPKAATTPPAPPPAEAKKRPHPPDEPDDVPLSERKRLKAGATSAAPLAPATSHVPIAPAASQPPKPSSQAALPKPSPPKSTKDTPAGGVPATSNAPQAGQNKALTTSAVNEQPVANVKLPQQKTNATQAKPTDSKPVAGAAKSSAAPSGLPAKHTATDAAAKAQVPQAPTGQGAAGKAVSALDVLKAATAKKVAEQPAASTQPALKSSKTPAPPSAPKPSPAALAPQAKAADKPAAPSLPKAATLQAHKHVPSKPQPAKQDTTVAACAAEARTLHQPGSKPAQAATSKRGADEPAIAVPNSVTPQAPESSQAAADKVSLLPVSKPTEQAATQKPQVAPTSGPQAATQKPQVPPASGPQAATATTSTVELSPKASQPELVAEPTTESTQAQTAQNGAKPSPSVPIQTIELPVTAPSVPYAWLPQPLGSPAAESFAARYAPAPLHSSLPPDSLPQPVDREARKAKIRKLPGVVVRDLSGDQEPVPIPVINEEDDEEVSLKAYVKACRLPQDPEVAAQVQSALRQAQDMMTGFADGCGLRVHERLSKQDHELANSALAEVWPGCRTQQHPAVPWRDGRLTCLQPLGVYQCSDACGPEHECNRQVLAGIQLPLQVRRVKPEGGEATWALCCEQDIPAGQLVCTVAGDVTTLASACSAQAATVVDHSSRSMTDLNATAGEMDVTDHKEHSDVHVPASKRLPIPTGCIPLDHFFKLWQGIFTWGMSCLPVHRLPPNPLPSCCSDTYLTPDSQDRILVIDMRTQCNVAGFVQWSTDKDTANLAMQPVFAADWSNPLGYVIALVARKDIKAMAPLQCCLT